MKVLSMHNPHAVLSVYGYKTIETRAMDTHHRGWLAVHATKEWPAEYRGMMDVWPTIDCLIRINMERRDKGWEPWFRSELPDSSDELANALPRGAIVGLVYVAKTESVNGITERWNRREHQWNLRDPDYNDVPAWEPSFGDYTNGRRAWWFAHPIPLRTPVEVRGWPGLWTTEAACERDGYGQRPDDDCYEDAIYRDLQRQGVQMPDLEPAFSRTINRRGLDSPNAMRNQ